MASSILSFPNINNLITYKGKYLRPNIDTEDSSYYILTDTNDKYLLTNTNITNKPIDIEVFAVGGGGAGGYYNGNGGDGGMVIYKKIKVKSNDILELSVGKGAFYVNDKNFINGFQLKIYEGYIDDFFSTRNNYIMNTKPADLINAGLIKKVEQKISNIKNLKSIAENEVVSTLITNPIQNELCNENPNPENCEGAVSNWFMYNKGYTLEINTYLIVPFDCSIEIEITAFKYGILFFYNDEDINNKFFNNDLTYYRNYSNNYWIEIENDKKIFKRNNIKANDKYYIKILHSQDKEITSNESKFDINFKLIVDDKIIELIDDKYFKFNNSIENYGIYYSTPTTIYDKKKNDYLINASGGNTGILNPDTINFGKGGCLTYDINNKKIKICKDDGNGTSGLKLPENFRKNLIELPYYSYRYGSGGGGAFWRLNGYGGIGGPDGGNGISFTNIPSLSRPTNNTGGGGGGNSFLTNITERMLSINKLSGADGILILKIIKTTEQTLVQTFVNMSDVIKVKIDENDIIKKTNSNIELIYKTDKINYYNPSSLESLVNLTDDENANYGITITDLYIFFTNLINRVGEYINLKEKDRLRFPLKIIYDKNKKPLFLEYKYYNLNLYDFNNNINYYFGSITNEKIIKSLNKIFSVIYNKEIVYNPSLDNLKNIYTLKDTNNFTNYYIKKAINDLLNPEKLVLFIENTNKNYFYYFTYLINYTFYNNINDYIVKQKISKSISINRIKELIQNIEYFNKYFFTPIDKNNDINTDTKIDDKNSYVYQQTIYKDIYNNNVNQLIKSNNVTNFSINNFKAKYQLNKKNNWFNTIFFIIIFILIISFFYIYTNFEKPLHPLLILICIIIISILIIALWYTTSNQLKIFEKFNCDTTKKGNINIDCLDNKGSIIPINSDLLPYYYISNSSNNNDFIKIEPTSNLLVDIFLYGTPLSINSNNNTIKYYEPNIDIYKNILLPNTSSYSIYNNKIIISSDDNPDSIFINERKRNISSLNINNTLNIYNCSGLRKDICEDYITINLTNKYTTYDITNRIIPNMIPQINSSILLDNFDFSPNTNNKYYNFSIDNINTNVLRQPFIIIKVKNDLEDMIENFEEVIHEFKRVISIFEINMNLFLLNKNTKKIIDFINKYETDNQKDFTRAFEYNDNIYERNQQAYSILNLEIMTNFYLKLLLCIIILIYLLCVLLYHYFKNNFFNILFLGLILTTLSILIILYIIYKHQRIDSDKYYFIKPDKYKNQ
jgi:hypothetical protein